MLPSVGCRMPIPAPSEVPSWPPEADVRAFILFRRGAHRDSHSRSLHPRSARLGANTEDKVRCSHVTPCHTAGTRPADPGSLGADQCRHVIGERKSWERRVNQFILLALNWPRAHRRGGGVHPRCQQNSPLSGPLHRATTSGNVAASCKVTFSP